MPPGRGTRTGGVFEAVAVPALQKNGYSYRRQVNIGPRLGGGVHKVDLLVETPLGVLIPVSAKWQQVSGTAEEKVPYEVIKLIYSIEKGDQHFPYAYLVLGGNGWRPELKKFYILGGLQSYIPKAQLVRIVDLYSFIARANNRDL
jgi:hypothetical protein